MSRKIIGYKENLSNEYIITPAERDIMAKHSNVQNNSKMFLSDERIDEIKEMVKSL